MTVLAHQRDCAVIERRQNYCATAMMNYFASVGLISLSNRIDRNIKHPALKNLFARDDLWRLELRCIHATAI